MSARAVLSGLAPPLLVRLVRRARGQTLRFTGQPRDWAEACRASSGYGDAAIIDRVAQATRAVVAGRAAFERDGVAFQHQEYPFPLVAALMRVAVLGGGQLDVVDFGGSLGSTFRQCLPLMRAVPELRWHVIEQPSFVALGRAEFATEHLQFFASVADLPVARGPRVLLMSSVLQYLQTPWDALQAALGHDTSHLVIDRTPWSAASTDRLCVQHVPRNIYRGSYPCWILSRSGWLDRLSARWRLVAEIPSVDGPATTAYGLPFIFSGFVFERLP